MSIWKAISTGKIGAVSEVDELAYRRECSMDRREGLGQNLVVEEPPGKRLRRSHLR